MDQDLLELLKRVDTPTVCNAIEVAEGKRGFAGFTRGTPIASHPQEPAMVGYAKTARIRGKVASTESPEAIRSRRMDYYRYMAGGPSPSVAVIEDLDHPDCVGAFWGEVNTTLHKGLGVAGALTNGVMRDRSARAMASFMSWISTSRWRSSVSTSRRVPDHARPLFILPGVAQRVTGEPDVTRGEETLHLGLPYEESRRIVCLPGTHSKWAALDNARIDRFATFVTGPCGGFPKRRTATCRPLFRFRH